MGGGAKKQAEYFTVVPATPLLTGKPADVAAAIADAPPGPTTAGDATPATDSPMGEVAAPTATPSIALMEAPDAALTPVPVELEVGAICGEAVIVGGADLEDSLATLVSYDSPGGPIEVLHVQVTPEAQPKLLEALALSDEQLIPVAVEKQVAGRLPIDEQHQLYEQLEVVAKSVNHHLKAGDAIPAHTHDNFDKLTAKLGELADTVTDDEQAMVAHYQAGLEKIAERIGAGYDVGYDIGGKLPHLDPYEVSQTVTVTEYVPAPADDIPAGLLSAQVRDATRLQPKVDQTGRVSWDGTARSKADGKEYRIDLGEGYQAVYRPHLGANMSDKDKAAAGHRGHLELIAPPGGGHPGELIGRLGQLNLVNRPMTRAEGEWAYLKRNIWAQRLQAKPAVAAAVSQAAGLADTMEELVFVERAHEGIGLDGAQLGRLASDIRLEAEARALPHQVAMVRDAVAKVCGHPDGAALAASPGYDPTPRRSGGWVTWERCDVAADPATTTSLFKGKALYHRVTGDNLPEMLRNGGVLASTERRRMMGIRKGVGMSEAADMKTGGSKAVDLRAGKPPSKGPHLIWSDPSRLLRRADWYAYPSDHFAAAVNEGGHSTSSQTRSPADVAAFTGGSNEVLFANGIDLLGAEAPDRILCSSPTQRSEVLAVLKGKAITHLAGKPVTEVVQ